MCDLCMHRRTMHLKRILGDVGWVEERRPTRKFVKCYSWERSPEYRISNKE